MASRALVIGVGSYGEDSGITGYETIGRSADLYGETLARDPRWGDSPRPIVLGQDSVRTADAVMRALQEAVGAAAGPEDTLLVVYVGHGAHWKDVPDGQVHFAVGSSRANEPWTWLSSWYVYRAMKQSKAGLKVLIADCCYSNLLPQLSPEATTLPGALGARARGTCVFTAVGDDTYNAEADPCGNLPAPLDSCTPFSGHLLKVLQEGMHDHPDDLTLGALRAGIGDSMRECQVHVEPRMVLNEAPDATALFTNHAKGHGIRRLPNTVDDWVSHLRRSGDGGLQRLMSSPELAGQVVVRLRAGDEQSRDLARRVDHRADELLSEPADFVRYWAEVEPPILSGG